MCYEFGEFKVDGDRKALFKGKEIIHLPPKVFATLFLLVENAGRLMRKEKILETVWADSFVEDNNLQQHISQLRKVLSDAKLIKTIPKLGYCFAGSVKEANSFVSTAQENTGIVLSDNERNEQSSNPSTPSLTANLLPTSVPETRYVENGDVNIAYQVVGAGDLDIVFVMGWVSHLEYFWKHHSFASFLNRLASFSRLILFDKRGTGLSDRVPLSELPTLEQRMEDVHAVMDAVGSERAVLIGVSEGGPMCSLFAATYPEKTTALVMIGTYAKRIRDEEYPWGVSMQDREAFFEQMRRDWGKPVGIEERAPTMARDEEFRHWWAEYLRMGASPGAAVALTKMNAEIDVRNVLPLVRVPTLVIHRSGDLCLKVEEGRFVASLIPASKYVELDGIDHLPFVGAQEEILDEIEEFLTGMRHAEEYDRVLATVMCVKITNIETADEIKFGKWQEFLKDSHIFVQRKLELFRGREVSFDAQGLLAVFDGPARAIRCAMAINDSAQRLNISLKIGLHTGECDVAKGRKYSGLAVDFSKKIAESSNFGDILVSRTVKDLVAGSGLEFQESGKKLSSETQESWKLFTIKGTGR
jgi:pimeloyl-ACP methyl ester carboxylesterase/DNA-binding winged helix-turn-helix (wHTH) protein/class 3 adenylate cyclase